MTARYRGVLLGAAAIVMFAITGCGGFSCDDPSQCSGDEKPSSAEVDSCQKALDGDCGGEFEDYASCFQDNQVCDSNDKTDGEKTFSAAQKNCSDEIGALTACCLKNSSAEGCG